MSRRHVTDADRHELLAAMAQCRRVFLAATERAAMGSAVHRDLQTVIALFDELALELTGSREHLVGTSPGRR